MPLSALLLAGKYASMTCLFSLAYLGVFLPVCLIVYQLFPAKGKPYFLLAASYLFFWLISGKLVIYLLLTTFSMHYFGLWLDRLQRQRDALLETAEKENRKTLKAAFLRRQRRVVTLAVLLHIGVLLLLKYSPFFTTNVNTLFSALHLSLKLQIPHYLMPIGISFFTLQALSYLIDVGRGVSKADENLFRLALFIGFFPQIIEGPICRYAQTADALWHVRGITYENLTHGLQRILYGMMKKLVVADRLNPLVVAVFDSGTAFDGGVVALGAIAYTVQLYMDFSGAMDAVIGTAQIFGVTLPENFARPFFSRTISEFWKRWHITLGTWFRDYIFYPVTTAKPMKQLTSSARKKIGNHYGPLCSGAIALFAVWSCNGLWHGAAWSYLFFGMYHFVLILGGNLLIPPVRWINEKCHFRPESFPYRMLQIVRTTVLVIIGELFFRARGLRAGLSLFGTMVSRFSFPVLSDTLLAQLGVDRFDLIIAGVALLIVFIISLLKEKGIAIRASLALKPRPVRFAVLYALILFIVVFGAYGPGYLPVDPIYANF